jgi:predicted nucleic acid-binding protein|tara:strand:- start:8577 stop:8957 length:381 start_codon:yes stop_codon:yes gene_type:complete
MNNFIDSNIFVIASTEHKDKNKCIDRIKKGGCINTLILLEAYAKLGTITKDIDYADAVTKQIISDEKIVIVNFDVNLFFEASKRAKKYGLKISDLIHYTTALLQNCPSIISYDKDFDNLEIKRIEP